MGKLSPIMPNCLLALDVTAQKCVLGECKRRTSGHFQTFCRANNPPKSLNEVQSHRFGAQLFNFFAR